MTCLHCEGTGLMSANDGASCTANDPDAMLCLACVTGSRRKIEEAMAEWLRLVAHYHGANLIDVTMADMEDAKAQFYEALAGLVV